MPPGPSTIAREVRQLVPGVKQAVLAHSIQHDAPHEGTEVACHAEQVAMVPARKQHRCWP